MKHTIPKAILLSALVVFSGCADENKDKNKKLAQPEASTIQKTANTPIEENKINQEVNNIKPTVNTDPLVEILNEAPVTTEETKVESAEDINGSVIQANIVEPTAKPVPVATPTPLPTPIPAITKTYNYNTPYNTPKGQTELTVKFVVTGEKVKSFTLTGNPAHSISIQKQAVFSQAAQSYVIGKSIEELKAVPGVLNGSSLTSVGFNKAISLLKSEA